MTCRKTSITREWRPTQPTIQRIKADYPGLDHNASWKKFVLYHLSAGTTSADWDSAFELWVARDYEKREKEIDEGGTDDLGYPRRSASRWHKHIS